MCVELLSSPLGNPFSELTEEMRNRWYFTDNAEIQGKESPSLDHFFSLSWFLSNSREQHMSLCDLLFQSTRWFLGNLLVENDSVCVCVVMFVSYGSGDL